MDFCTDQRPLVFLGEARGATVFLHTIATHFRRLLCRIPCRLLSRPSGPLEVGVRHLDVVPRRNPHRVADPLADRGDRVLPGKVGLPPYRPEYIVTPSNQRAYDNVAPRNPAGLIQTPGGFYSTA